MLRIILFLGTNIAILALLSVTFSLFGIQGLLAHNGVDLNLTSLLIFSALIGFAGSFISLLVSKWMAKRSMAVHVIEQPSNATEHWLVETVRALQCKYLLNAYLVYLPKKWVTLRKPIPPFYADITDAKSGKRFKAIIKTKVVVGFVNSLVKP